MDFNKKEYVFKSENEHENEKHPREGSSYFECSDNRILIGFAKKISGQKTDFYYESAPLMIDPAVRESASIEVVPKDEWILASENGFKYDYKVPNGHVIIGYKKVGPRVSFKCAAVLVNGTPLQTIYETEKPKSGKWVKGYALGVVKQVLTGMSHEIMGYGRFLFYKGN